MNKRAWVVVAGLCVGVLVLSSSSAHAFFPMGVFLAEDEYSAATLRIPRWPLRYMDVNGDGDVSGPNEGILITFESGDEGWTQAEQEAMQIGFETWENVPSAYCAFRYGQAIGEPPLETSADLGASDLINYVANVPEGDVVPAGFIGITLISFIVQDMTLEVGGISFPVTGPAMIDVDIAIIGDFSQINAEIDLGTFEGIFEAGVPLHASVVHLAGLMLGLAQSPMQNFQEALLIGADIPEGVLVDPPVYAQRTAAGGLELVGVTPSMYPVVFLVDRGNNVFRVGWENLAPDDIAGITYLYPRGDLESFFQLKHEARFNSQLGFPSFPIAGGFIQLWCDADNNPATSRVPMFSTITSLYETEEEFSGFFRLINTFKQLETAAGVPFTGSYTVTLSEVVAPDGYDVPKEFFDSTHRGLLEGGGGFAFSTGYPYQVFLEGAENIYGLARHDEGTALLFDPLRRKIVSAQSGKTLEQMLPGTRPMFGDALSELICPLNLATQTLKTQDGPRALRQFRDAVLLKSAGGAAVADTYYRMAPSISAFLVGHERVLGMVRRAARAVEWSVDHRRACALGAALAVIGLLRLRYRSWKRAHAVAVLLLLALVLFMGEAHAQFIGQSIEGKVAKSQDIVAGRVVAAGCRWTEQGQIVTDVTIQVDDTMKGRLNKRGLVHFSQLGGAKDGIVTYVPQYPSWKMGEEVVVFLEPNKQFGHMTVGGVTGKHTVHQDSETGEKYIVSPSIRAKMRRRDAAKQQQTSQPISSNQGGQDKKEKSSEPETNTDRVLLESFKAYLREIVQEHEKNRR